MQTVLRTYSTRAAFKPKVREKERERNEKKML